MELFSWVTYPSEHRYLTIVFGCKQNPSLDTLTLLRLYTVSHNRYPTLDEFLLFAVKECEAECEFFLPLPELLDATRFSLIEYGFIPRCRLGHYMYNFRVFENRYPTATEIYNYLQSFSSESSPFSRVINELMERDTQDYWEKKQSGLTEQDIYKLVETNEEKELMCCVCQEEIAEGELVVRLECRHSFHRGAQYKLAPEDRLTTVLKESDCQGVEEWLKKSGTCPVCRASVSH